MKTTRGLMAVALVMCVVQPALGQSEKIALYADASGSDCSVTDTAPGVVEVHIIHVGSDQRKAASFRAPTPTCWTGAVWLGDILSPPFLALGSSHGDYWDVAYGSCLALPVYIGKMNFFGAGTGNPCCEYPVISTATRTTILSVDCQLPFGSGVVIGGGSATINENSSCLCDPPLAVEETTWGRVKAFYR